jgi:hypothetical protein
MFGSITITGEFKDTVKYFNWLAQLRVDAKMNRIIKEEADIVRRMYEKTVRTWNHPASFKYQYVQNGIIVYTDSEQYMIIDDGGITHDVMSRDFIPKTKPRVIGSSMGRGGKAGWNPNRYHRIEARLFTDEIAARREPMFTHKMDKFMDDLVSGRIRGSYE